MSYPLGTLFQQFGSATRNKCQLWICELLAWKGGILPLTLPLLYDDNKSRKKQKQEVG